MNQSDAFNYYRLFIRLIYLITSPCSSGPPSSAVFQTFAWHNIRCSYGKTKSCLDRRRGEKHDGNTGKAFEDGQEVEVLHGISGILDKGQMLAVIGEKKETFDSVYAIPYPSCLNSHTQQKTGPSGSGKTCLMDILAARKSVGRVEGIPQLVDGAVPSPTYFKQHASYVSQEIVFHPTATVKEIVLFQAHLR